MSAADLTSTASGEHLAAVGGLEICYETFGPREAPPVLLVMGLASQMIMWDDEFCERLATRGFWVIRFDNRDCGRSTILDEAGAPNLWQLMTRNAAAARYSLDDMAEDAVGVLDHLGIRAAHVVGASMGGMIAQLIAIRHPDRVLSLVSIMSTTGNRRVGRAHPRLIRRLLRRRRSDRAGAVEDHVATFRAIGSTGYPFDEPHERQRGERCFDRGFHPGGYPRQLAAIMAASDRTEALKATQIPSTVIHGDADPLVNVSGGRATAEAIPGAKLVILPGMGHDLPRALWPQIIGAITDNATSGTAHA